MATDHAIPELDSKGLRQFGLTTGAIVAVLFGLFFPWWLERAWPLWPWIIAGFLWVPALIHPLALRLVYRGWMRFGLLLNRITTPLVLGIVFFLLISPLAVFRRLRGKDTLQRRFDAGQKSYRVQTEKHDLTRLEKPF